MSRTGVIPMEVSMLIPQGPVVGAMLGLAIEPFLVGAPVGLVDLAVESPVGPVVTSVLTIVVIMRERRSGRGRDGQHRRRNQSFADGHGVSPVEVPDAEILGRLQFSSTVRLPF